MENLGTLHTYMHVPNMTMAVQQMLMLHLCGMKSTCGYEDKDTHYKKNNLDQIMCSFAKSYNH